MTDLNTSLETLAAGSPGPTLLAQRTYPYRQGQIFAKLRWALARNGLKVMLASGRTRLVSMTITSMIVGLFVLLLSWYGFHQMHKFQVPIKGMIVGGLFDLMFFTLGAMLIFSTGIILYASLFTAPEARFLLATPATADQIFASKFQAAIAFSSWAFLILGVPILISYGIVAGVPWYFYPLLPITLIGFVLLPGSLSALGCLLFVRYFPRNRKQGIIGVILITIALSGLWGYQTLMAARNTALAGRRVANELDTLIAQFSLTQSPLMPSHWMTNAVMAAAREELFNSLLYTAMLWSNGLIAFLLAGWAAGRIYRSGFDRIAGRSGKKKKAYRGYILDRIMEGLVFYLDRSTRILVVKDFRTFRRDPTQWVLLFVFAGMLLLGASNFRQYARSNLELMDRYVVSLVNLMGTSVLLCAGLSRFIYPLISLEGRKFWILGLMPISREQILRGKFAFAATGSSVIALGLILPSDMLLGLPANVVFLHCLTGLVVALGLSGLNVGLGAYMPNFRETDPSKIVVGFGGTMNMVIGLMYLTLIVMLMSGPLYAAAVIQRFGMKTDANTMPAWIYFGLPLGLILCVAAVYLPMRAGARSLRATEF